MKIENLKEVHVFLKNSKEVEKFLFYSPLKFRFYRYFTTTGKQDHPHDLTRNRKENLYVVDKYRMIKEKDWKVRSVIFTKMSMKRKELQPIAATITRLCNYDDLNIIAEICPILKEAGYGIETPIFGWSRGYNYEGFVIVLRHTNRSQPLHPYYFVNLCGYFHDTYSNPVGTACYTSFDDDESINQIDGNMENDE